MVQRSQRVRPVQRSDDISIDVRSPSASPVWAPGRTRLVVGVVLALAGPLLIAVTFLPFRDGVAGATVGMVMLVPTAIAAAVGGPVAALSAVAVGSVLHNALFTVPHLTLRMSEPGDVLSLAAHVLVGAIVSAVVMREQRAAHAAARRQEAEARLVVLEEVDRTRAALLAAVSHDLRTPLAAIAAAASDLQDSGVEFSDEQRAVLVDTIAERAALLERRVGQLLAASRLEVGAVTVAVEAVDLQELLDEAIVGLAAAADERVQARLSPRLSPVMADPALIVAVLGNLIDNALRYSPADRPVVVSGEPAGDVVVVAVIDEGPGLAAETEGMFSALQPDADGAGLGLAIAHGFVRLHGGTLEHHPTPGGGATFEFTLPATKEPAA
jgi:two-component system, OmpR family, sensor histidine kinase KdpD